MNAKQLQNDTLYRVYAKRAPKRRTSSEAYQAGLAARRDKLDPEPHAPYAPGTKDYADFAAGFCHDPMPHTYLDNPQNRKVKW